MRIGSLFSGYGGLDLAVESVLGGTPAWFVEFDQAPSKILAHHWPDVPNLGDITAVDWDTVEPVDVLTGGFPCQDLSHAGKRLGLRPGTRSGLWEHMAYAINQLRPRMVVIENVRGLLSAEAHSDKEPHECWCVGDDGDEPVRAIGAVLWDLAGMGYVGSYGLVSASEAGAPHGRARVFIVAQPADAESVGREWGGTGHQGQGGRGVGATEGHHWTPADADLPGLEGRPAQRERAGERPAGPGGVGAVALLPTPKASDGPNGGPGMRNGRGEADALPGVVSLLPTPVGTDSIGARNATATRPEGSAHHSGTTLTDVAWQQSWGRYAPAIERWERVIGRRAPAPTEPGRNGPRLAPLFVEWMMGLPLGHVTAPAIGLTRAQQLKALGNGVVPQQAALALRLLLGLDEVAVA